VDDTHARPGLGPVSRADNHGGKVDFPLPAVSVIERVAILMWPFNSGVPAREPRVGLRAGPVRSVWRPHTQRISSQRVKDWAAGRYDSLDAVRRRARKISQVW